MLSCRKGRVCLFQGLLLLGFIGCSDVFRGVEPYTSEIPVSNAQVAQKVIELALENAGVPHGQGTEVSYKVDGDPRLDPRLDQGGVEDNLLGIIALEFLLKHGYRVVENKDSSPIHSGTEIRFSLDTLYVNLYPRLDRGESRTTKMSKLIRRHSEAHIKIVFLIVRAEHVQPACQSCSPVRRTRTMEGGADRPLLPEFKKVYKGRGVMEDTFPSYMLESVIPDLIGDGESFTTIFPAQDRIIKNVQPFLLGITMTALVWLLYSYRG